VEREGTLGAEGAEGAEELADVLPPRRSFGTPAGAVLLAVELSAITGIFILGITGADEAALPPADDSVGAGVEVTTEAGAVATGAEGEEVVSGSTRGGGDGAGRLAPPAAAAAALFIARRTRGEAKLLPPLPPALVGRVADEGRGEALAGPVGGRPGTMTEEATCAEDA
jgi:hypothetical protein